MQLKDVLADGPDLQKVEDEADDRAGQDDDEEQADGAHGGDC